MDPVISYNFAEIDASVSHDIAATSARLHAALEQVELGGGEGAAEIDEASFGRAVANRTAKLPHRHHPANLPVRA